MTQRHKAKSSSRLSAGLSYFMIRVAPAPDSKLTKHGGAYVSCWVNFPHGEGAFVLAKHYIRQAGWQFRKLQEHKWVTRATYRGHSSLQYYDEAAKDGSSFVFHVYPRKRAKRSNQPLKARPRVKHAAL